MNESVGSRRAYPLNAPGDFYVEDQMCIACAAPEHEAPDLMAHDSGDHYHCYFKRQPQTRREVDRAIMAVAVGCCGAVRYGGHDRQIVEKLTSLRPMEDLCDHT